MAVGFVADERGWEDGGGGWRVEERGVEVVAADVFEAGERLVALRKTWRRGGGLREDEVDGCLSLGGG